MIAIDEIPSAPERLKGLSREELLSLLRRIAMSRAAVELELELSGGAPADSPNGGGHAAPTRDRLVGVKEAAKSFGVSVSEMYRNSDRYGGVKVGRRLMFSAEGLDTYMKTLRATRGRR